MPCHYEPMAEAPALRELIVQNCPPVAMEVAAIQAGLPPWDDLFLRPEPRPLGPLQLVTAPPALCVGFQTEQLDPGEEGLIDTGLRECEARWVRAFATRSISEKIGHSDWGNVIVNGMFRTLSLTIESFDVVEQLPEIVQATREVLARLQPEYQALFGIHLRVQPPTPTPAQQAVEDKWRDQQDAEDFEQRQRDRAEYLERLHELELKRQQGLEIEPDDFSPSETCPRSKPRRARRQTKIPTSSSTRTKTTTTTAASRSRPTKTPTSTPSSATNICSPGTTFAPAASCSTRCGFPAHLAGIGCHLMRRQPDRVIPEEKKDLE